MAEQPFGRAYGGNPPANYERFFVPAIGAPLATDLVRLAALRSGRAGAGRRLRDRRRRPARRAAGRCRRDRRRSGRPSGMLAVARSATPPGLPIEWHEASAEAMPLPDASFDVVLCQMGLQFMPDRRAALREMRRVLVPRRSPAPQRARAHAATLHASCPGGARASCRRPARRIRGPRLLAPRRGRRFRTWSATPASTMCPCRLTPSGSASRARGVPLAVRAQHPARGARWRRSEDERRGLLEREVVAGWQEFVEDGALVLEVRIVHATARKA